MCASSRPHVIYMLKQDDAVLDTVRRLFSQPHELSGGIDIAEFQSSQFPPECQPSLKIRHIDNDLFKLGYHLCPPHSRSPKWWGAAESVYREDNA